jgi:hypothetical protein
MSKSWLDTEDGRNALEAIRENPEALQVFFVACQDHLEEIRQKVLGCNVADPSKDREFIVARAELLGAESMVRLLKQRLEKPERPRKKV